MTTGSSEQPALPYTPAESHPLPNWGFHVIEFPGTIENIENAFTALGGEESIARAFSEELGSLELRFRPNDPFSHPLIGEVISTSNLVLKVTRRKRKKPTGPNGTFAPQDQEMKTEVVGTVTKTCRFRALADYQYIMDRDDPIFKLRQSMGNYDVQHIEIANIKLTFLPSILMKAFRYRESHIDKDNTQETNSNVPMGPSQAIIDEAARLPAESIARLRALFGYDTETTSTIPPPATSRPIWTRLAIFNSIPKSDQKILKYLLPQVAYLSVYGPWRGTWTRYGYDPKKDKQARMYQVITMRFVKKPQALARAKRLIGVQDPQGLIVRNRSSKEDDAGGDENANAYGKGPESHIFDGTLWKGAALLQICDITDPEVKKCLQGNRGVKKSCDWNKGGWLEISILHRIRDIVRNKIMVQSGRAGREISTNDFVEDDEGGEVEEEEEEEEERQAEAEGEAPASEAGALSDQGGGTDVDEAEVDDHVAGIGGSTSTKDIDKKVASKVDELMKTLQSSTSKGSELSKFGMGNVVDEDEFEFYDEED
ncbi:tau 95 subunit of transcription factor TFIIIC [Blyttiomyces sp. JEL0837]|nr:tau 95 subunit of transcription factor TFIIIC [Blyttiomyces sp. JEL0837]